MSGMHERGVGRRSGNVRWRRMCALLLGLAAFRQGAVMAAEPDPRRYHPSQVTVAAGTVNRLPVSAGNTAHGATAARPALDHGAPIAVFPQVKRATGPIRPDYRLTDHGGREASTARFSGRYQLINFGYTSCADVCPIALATLAQVMRNLGADADRVQALFITVDPARDTPQRLGSYVTHFHPRLLGLYGSAAAIRHAADQFKVRYWREPAADGNPEHYTISHSAGLFLLGPTGELITRFSFRSTAAEISRQIRSYMSRDQASPK